MRCAREENMPKRSERRGSTDGRTRRIRKSRKSAAPTIIDVARTARVSTATVSRVLSHPEKVVDATREHVLRVIAELGYSPNASAKSLRTLQTRKILVIIPDIANPFFSIVLQGIEEAAIREGYSVLVGDTQNAMDSDTHYATMLPRREVDGLIVLSQKVPTVIKSWTKSFPDSAPVVTGFISGVDFGVSSASIDNVAAGAEALEHLHGLGHRRIGVIAGPAELPQVQERLNGIRAAAKRLGVIKNLCVEHGKFVIDTGTTCGSILLAKRPRPTAILCFSDDIAIAVFALARHLGLQLPEDLSVHGFDDLPTAAYLTPPLRTIALPMREVGRETVRLLVGRLEGKILKPRAIILPFRLVVRGSTGRPGSTDE